MPGNWAHVVWKLVTSKQLLRFEDAFFALISSIKNDPNSSMPGEPLLPDNPLLCTAKNK